MSEYNADHARISAEFLSRGREYLNNGELLQASEKGWGAAAHAAIFIAGSRGWIYREHRDFQSEVVSRIAGETGRSEVSVWARNAEALHRNFYSDRLDEHTIARHLSDVTNFVNLVRQLVGLPPVGD